MQVRVTLKLDEQVARKAKLIAKKRKKTLSDFLSDLLENYPDDDIEIKASEIHPSIKPLMGILHLPDNFDKKIERHKYLDEKYGRG